MIGWTMALVGILILCASTVFASDFEVRPGFRVIDSIADLREVMVQNDQKIRMKPGVYRVADALSDNQTVFLASGSNNHFDLRDVTIQIDTRVLFDMTSKKAHELATYRIYGEKLTFEGAIFEDVGDLPPQRSLSEFSMRGDHITFKACTFIIRGSAPYGYGSLFGKGRQKTYRGLLKKHSAMSVNGDHTQILGCKFYIYTFGHAIHMHGAQNTLIRDTYIEGTLRPTDELLAETSGPAFDLGFVDMWDRPIPKGKMLALAEDGIRAYTSGVKDGEERRTGKITVINCTVHRMRGSISLSLASAPAEVTGCTVTEAGWTGMGYGLPSKSVVRDCKGDAAYTSLLNMTRSNKKEIDVELEVLDARSYVGDHPLAILNGSDHRVVLRKTDGQPLAKALEIVCGVATRNDGKDKESAICRRLELINQTVQPVVLTDRASDGRGTSVGAIVDRGENNSLRQIQEQR